MSQMLLGLFTIVASSIVTALVVTLLRDEDYQ